jgi:endoglucanase
VLAPGAGWDGAHDFVSGAGGATPNAVAMAGLVDPAGALAFEVHQYIDADFSGTHTDCPAAGRAAALLQPFTDWMRDGGRHGFLGEFGVPPRPECLAALAEMVRFMDDNRDVWAGWAYWAAGAWWGPAYPYSIEPADGQDRPQAKVLRHPARSAP